MHVRKFFVKSTLLTILSIALWWVGEAHAAKASKVFTLTSPSYKKDTMIPDAYTCEGGDSFPEYEWENPPKGTVSYVLMMEDFDVPKDRKPDGYWLHCLIFDIPADVTFLPRGMKTLPKGAKFGKNTWKRNDYGGPCPPDRQHDYPVTVYALDSELHLKEGATLDEVKAKMKGHILKEDTLNAQYNKPENR